MGKREQKRIRELENKVAQLEVDATYYRKQIAWYKDRLGLIKTAWSIVHPLDLAYMQQAKLARPHMDAYNGLIYSYGRPLPDHTCATRLRSFEHAEYYRGQQLRNATPRARLAASVRRGR